MCRWGGGNLQVGGREKPCASCARAYRGSSRIPRQIKPAIFLPKTDIFPHKLKTAGSWLRAGLAISESGLELKRR